MGHEDDDGTRLREALDSAATAGELEEFIFKNRKMFAPGAEAIMRRFSPMDQRHIMRRGELPFNCTEQILKKRLKEGRDLGRQLAGMVARKGSRRNKDKEDEADEAEAGAAQVAFVQGLEMNQAISMAEVSAAESRFAPAAKGEAAIPPSQSRPLKEGTVRGVGGVIEVTKKKFGCDPGTRLEVVGEKGNLWQCQGGVTIIKFQKDGWRWVLRADIAQAEEEEAKRNKTAKTGEKSGQAVLAMDDRLRAIRALQERESKLAEEQRTAMKLERGKASSKNDGLSAKKKGAKAKERTTKKKGQAKVKKAKASTASESQDSSEAKPSGSSDEDEQESAEQEKEAPKKAKGKSKAKKKAGAKKGSKAGKTSKKKVEKQAKKVKATRSSSDDESASHGEEEDDGLTADPSETKKQKKKRSEESSSESPLATRAAKKEAAKTTKQESSASSSSSS